MGRFFIDILIFAGWLVMVSATAYCWGAFRTLGENDKKGKQL